MSLRVCTQFVCVYTHKIRERRNPITILSTNTHVLSLIISVQKRILPRRHRICSYSDTHTLLTPSIWARKYPENMRNYSPWGSLLRSVKDAASSSSQNSLLVCLYITPFLFVCIPCSVRGCTCLSNFCNTRSTVSPCRQSWNKKGEKKFAIIARRLLLAGRAEKAWELASEHAHARVCARVRESLQSMRTWSATADERIFDVHVFVIVQCIE